MNMSRINKPACKTEEGEGDLRHYYVYALMGVYVIHAHTGAGDTPVDQLQQNVCALPACVKLPRSCSVG